MYNYEDSVAWIVYNDEPTIQDVDEMSGMATVCLLSDSTGKASEEVAKDVVMRRILNMLAEQNNRVRPPVIKLTVAQRDLLFTTQNCSKPEGVSTQWDNMPLAVLLRCELKTGSGRHVSVTEYLQARVLALIGSAATNEQALLTKISEAIYYAQNPGGLSPAARQAHDAALAPVLEAMNDQSAA